MAQYTNPKSSPSFFPYGQSRINFSLGFSSKYSSKLCPCPVGVSRIRVPMGRKNGLVRRNNKTLFYDREKALKTTCGSTSWKWLPRSTSWFRKIWWILGRAAEDCAKVPQYEKPYSVVSPCLSPTPFPLIFLHNELNHMCAKKIRFTIFNNKYITVHKLIYVTKLS